MEDFNIYTDQNLGYTKRQSKNKNKKKKKKDSRVNRKKINTRGVNFLIDDLLNLISIAFISIGIKDHVFSQYSLLTTIERLLDTKAYNTETIIPIRSKLLEILIILDGYYTKRSENDSELEYLDDEGDEIFSYIDTKYFHCDKKLTSIETHLNETSITSGTIDERLYPLLESLLNFKKKINTVSLISVYVCTQKLLSKNPQKEIELENRTNLLKADIGGLRHGIIKI